MATRVVIPADVFQGLEARTIFNICKNRGLTVQKEETKRQIIARLVDEVTDLGVRHLVGQLKKTTVENIAAELDIEHHSKVVLGKRLYERIVETGVSQFFESKVDIQDLRDICDTLVSQAPMHIVQHHY
jgi:hypothetical protein